MADCTQETGQPAVADGGAKVQCWERPWTVDEMRKAAGDWSLAGDAGMLHYLQDFSQRIISRTHDIQEQVNGLVHESKLTGTHVQNAFNDFIMLANTQFVENRVYDEDINTESVTNAEKKEEKEQTREEREAQLIPKMTQAMQLGFNVIDTAFEKLDVNDVNSDSEEDEGSPYLTDTILEPKDPYLSRALPYLIGSQAFMTDDDVGLIDVMSEEEQSDHGSISQSESESESESDEPKLPAHKATVLDSDSESMTDSSESESELFGMMEDDSDVSPVSDEDDISQPAGPGKFAGELAAKLSAAEAGDKPENLNRERKHSAGKKESRRSRTSSKSLLKPQVNDDDEDLFGPPPMEDDDSPFSRKGGLFASDGGLFDDKDEGGLFDDVIAEKPHPTPVAQSRPQEAIPESSSEEEEKPAAPVTRARTKSGRKVPVGGVSIFGGGDDDLFMGKKKQTPDSDSEEEEEPPPMMPATQPAMKKNATTNAPLGLFDDDDDDLFTAVAQKKTAPPKKDTAPAPAPVDLFGDDDDGDLFAVTSPPVKKQSEKEKEKVKPQKKLPAGAVPMFGNQGNPLAATIRAQRPPSDKQSSDEDWENDKASESSSRSGASSTMRPGGLSAGLPTKTASPALSSSSLFAEEPEDDLLTVKPNQDALLSTKTASKPKPAASKGLFGEDSEEEDLFSATTTAKPKPTQAPVSQSKPCSTSLFFDDDEEDSLFGTAPKPAKKQEPAAKSKPPLTNAGLFDDDLFSSEVKGAPKVKEQPKLKEPPKVESKPKESEAVRVPARPRNATLSLFDEDENGTDLFGNQSSPPKSLATQPSTLDTKGTKPRTRSLFADDDVLFGGEGEDPAVDLFGSSSPLSPSEESKPFPPAPAAQKQEVTADSMPEARLKDKVEVKGATISASSTDLFSGGGGVAEPDLFTESAKKMDPTVEVRGATTSESSTDKSGKAAGRWKPVGGISMFGGMDPAMLKKRVGSLSSSPDTNTKPPPQELPAEDDIFSKPKTQPKPSASSIPPSSCPSSSMAIGKLQANLNLNPNALLPGAAPPQKDTMPVTAGFDTPVQASTLHTVQKDRVRGQNKRRPPTRKSRLNPSSSGEDFMSSTEVASSTPPAAFIPNNIFPAAAVSTAQPTTATISRAHKTMSAPSKDLFGSDDVDIANLFPSSRSYDSISRSSESSSKSAEPTLSGAKAPLRVKDTKADLDDLFSDAPSSNHSSVASVPKAMSSIFSEAFAKSKSGYSRVKGPLDNNDEDDLFGGTAAKKPEKKVIVDISDDLFGTPVQNTPNSSSMSKPSKAAPVADVPDDDIFGVTTAKTATKTVAKPTTPAMTNSKPLPSVDNDLEDLFSDASLTVKKSSKPIVSQEEDIFSSTQPKSKPLLVDDDDIFASASAKPSKAKTKATINFDDDDDDLFGAMPPPSSMTKKPTTKAASKPRAPSDGDIFADLPPSKSREKKAKKKPTANKGMFEDDDIDDIFAEKPKSKKRPTAKSKKPSDASANIFGKDGDATDLFDDPLNALMS